MDRSPRDAPAEKLPHPESLCHRCTAVRYVQGKHTLFVRCTALPTKYPPQPVRRCDAFRERP
jgi:hypothetical protein